MFYSIDWLQIPAQRIQSKVLSLTCTYSSIQYSQLTQLRELFTIQRIRSTRPGHHPLSLFLNLRSLHISCSPTELYPSLYQVSGMTCHHERRLRRTGGRFPKNLRLGMAHASVPQYLEK